MLLQNLKNSIKNIYKHIKNKWSPVSQKKKHILKQDAHILSICLGAMSNGTEPVFSEKTIATLSDFLNNEAHAAQIGNTANHPTIPSETRYALEKLLGDLDEPDAIGDDKLADIIATLNGLDPAIINEFLQKLIGKLDPETLENLFRKLFGRLLSHSSKITKESKQKTERMASEKLSKETRDFLNNLQRNTKEYLALRLKSNKLTDRQIILHDFIMQLSAATRNSTVSGVRIAGVEISPGFGSASLGKKSASPASQSEPGYDPDQKPETTPDPQGPKPHNASKGSPWTRPPKRP